MNKDQPAAAQDGEVTQAKGSHSPEREGPGLAPATAQSSAGEKKYRKRPVIVTAKQWFHPGDHPAVHPSIFATGDWGVDTIEGGFAKVVPGSWIMTGIRGEHYPCDPKVFAETYEPISPDTATPRVAGPDAQPERIGNKVRRWNEERGHYEYVEADAQPTPRAESIIAAEQTMGEAALKHHKDAQPTPIVDAFGATIPDIDSRPDSIDFDIAMSLARSLEQRLAAAKQHIEELESDSRKLIQYFNDKLDALTTQLAWSDKWELAQTHLAAERRAREEAERKYNEACQAVQDADERADHIEDTMNTVCATAESRAAQMFERTTQGSNEIKRRIRRSSKMWHNSDQYWGCKIAERGLTYWEWIDEAIDALTEDGGKKET